jgi:chromosomal replication initiation ATPase DnaA
MTLKEIQSELSNLRKVKSALLKARTLREEITRIQLQEVRDSIPDVNGLKINLPKIIEVVSQMTKIPASALMSAGRMGDICQARFIIFYLARNRLLLTFKQIGQTFSRDHGAIIHGCKSLQDKIDTEPKFRMFLAEIEKELEKTTTEPPTKKETGF